MSTPTFRKRLARALRQLSYRVDPPPPLPPGTPTAAEMLAARAAESARIDRLVDEMALRKYLEQALGRYQPIRLPGQA